MYKTLIISGGGLKGIGILGILEKILSHNFIKQDNIKFKHYLGSSVGSIICFLLSIGYSPLDIYFSIYKILPYKFISKNKIQVISLLNDLLQRKNIDINITFKIHYKTFKKDLVILSFDMNTKNTIIYNRKTTPNTQIIDAIKHSISIPYFLEDNNSFLDGCIGTPFPIKIAKEYKYKNIIGIYTKNEIKTLFPYRNIYDDIKIIVLSLINTLTEYEIMMSDKNDIIIEFDFKLPFELFYIETELVEQMFFKGLKTNISLQPKVASYIESEL